MGERIKLRQEKPGASVNHKTIGLSKTKSQSNQSPVDRILNLQKTIGNQAVTRLIQTGAIQASLKIGQPGDIYEREADRVADQVMRMPEQAIQRQVEEEEEEKIQTKPLAEQITPLIQRQIPPEEEEEPVQAKLRNDSSLQRQAEEEEEEIQAKLVSDSLLQRQVEEEEEEEEISPKASGNSPAVSSDIESRIQSMKSGGQPLSESTRTFFEPRFGADFSQVRVHTGSGAAETAQAINARAFTTGKDIVFGSGQYSPGTSAGKHLLAHELAHVVQQGKAVTRKHNALANTIHRMPEVSIYRAVDQCSRPYFVGYYGLEVNGRNWYSHDYMGPIDASLPYDVATPSSTGYSVPRSNYPNFNCMGWALCHGQPLGTSWLQGVPRSAVHPWPEEELLQSRGCSKINASTSAKHKVKLYEYKDRDQFHIVRQEHDALWSSKTGNSYLWRGIQNPDAHTTGFYSQPLGNLRITYWSCP